MKNSKRFIVRQGDVLITRVDSIPADAKPKKKDKGMVILAYGEVTGHAHRIERSDIAELHDADRQGTFLVLAEDTAVVHEEHSRLDLPAGTYRIEIQREYTPEAIVNVAD
jgi:hypothetical protein